VVNRLLPSISSVSAASGLSVLCTRAAAHAGSRSETSGKVSYRTTASVFRSHLLREELNDSRFEVVHRAYNFYATA
jgi:hypothetical protein